MADRTHSEIEDSRYGRYINLDILDDLLTSIYELKDKDHFVLSLDSSVENTIEDVLRTYLKWHDIKVIPNAKTTNVLATLHQSPSRFVLESNEKKSFPYHYDNLEKTVNVTDLQNNILACTGYHAMTFQSSSSETDIFTAIMTVREYYRHKMKAHKDCVITVNNADNFITKTNPNRTNPCCSGNCWAMNTISQRDNHGFDCICVAGDTTNDYYSDDFYIKNSGWNIGNNSSIDDQYIAPGVNFDADGYQYWVWCGFLNNPTYMFNYNIDSSSIKGGNGGSCKDPAK